MEIPEGRSGSHTSVCRPAVRRDTLSPTPDTQKAAPWYRPRLTHMTASRRRAQRAVSTIEVSLALSTLSLIVGLLVQSLLTSIHSATNLYSGVSIQVSAQHGLDLLSQDIEGADLCLAQYTVGATTYTSNANRSIVLRTPSLSSSGTTATASEDHIIYVLTATAAGASTGPYTLNRTIVPATGSGRTAINNEIVATNVSSASFSYVAAQTQTQNALGSLLIFVLLDGAVYSAPTGSVAVQQAIVAGVDQCSASTTCFSGGSLTLATAVTANAPMDLRFSVDPSATVSLSILSACGITCPAGESANFAKEVVATLQTTASAGSGNSLSAAPPSATLTTNASLRNKIAF